MANKYVNFITDEHLLSCVEALHQSYLKAKKNITKSKFYKNKIDTIKLTFDSKFNGIDEKELIEIEILRQIDKSINNSIGTFHEQILGGINGYEVGNLSGFDIKAEDNTLFAVFGHKKTRRYIAEATFHKLADDANIFRNARFYFVLLDDFSDLNENWVIGNEEFKVSQKRVFRISLKEFYAEITGQKDAYERLYKQLPLALKAFSIPQPS